jgi:osmotically-inducible protein OsmY
MRTFSHRGSRSATCSDVEDRAMAILEAHPHFHGRKRWVQCRCSKRRLFLTGTVPTYYLKQLAQEAVRNVDGVDQIVNQIVVVSRFSEPCAVVRVDKPSRPRMGSSRIWPAVDKPR